MTDLKALQDEAAEEYQEHGYEQAWNKWGNMGDLAEVGLVHTEIAEAQEELRDRKITSCCLELADAVIRIMNFCHRNGRDLEKLIKIAIKKNKDRPYLHARGLV